MIKRCIGCKIDKSDQEYYKLSYGEGVVNLCKECLLKEDNQMRPEDRYAGINYQQPWAKKYFREKRRRE